VVDESRDKHIIICIKKNTESFFVIFVFIIKSNAKSIPS